MPSTFDPVISFVAQYLAWARERQVRGTFMPTICYRGQSRDDWKLLPSLCREKLAIQLLQQLESEVIHEFRERFSLHGWNDVEILAFARHHGAPTRLLDWSRSPLVALWFATENCEHDENDGTIFQLNSFTKSTSVCSAVGVQLSHVEECSRLVHVFQGSQRVLRSGKQHSVFTIVPFKQEMALRPIDEVINESVPRVLRRFPVPRWIKSELRQLLFDLGLDAYTIFGDPDSFGKVVSFTFDLSRYSEKFAQFENDKITNNEKAETKNVTGCRKE